MTSGDDRVTLENFGNPDNPQNSKWNFQMYGPVAKQQTFHDQRKATGAHGEAPLTIHVRNTR
jgi:hypothetical protein